MKIDQRILSPALVWSAGDAPATGLQAQFVLVFGARTLLENPALLGELRHAYPGARLVLASAYGIAGTEILDNQLSVTAVAMEKSTVRFAALSISDPAESLAAGKRLAQELSGPDLVHVFVLADGLLAHGTPLVNGFNETLPAGVTLSGGLASDVDHFTKTVVGLDEAPAAGRVVAIGFYGRQLRVGIGSSGGWVPFGPLRTVTRSDDNTLFELDGQAALHLYKNYLGNQAAALPGSALRFPLGVTPSDGGPMIVRASLSVDEAQQSMHLAGDIPTGARVRFMRGSFDDLIAGAALSAEQSYRGHAPELALCVSCIGRHIVLGQRAEEELEKVREVLGPSAVLAGIYSNGELAPTGDDPRCRLHNETLTITTLSED